MQFVFLNWVRRAAYLNFCAGYIRISELGQENAVGFLNSCRREHR
jgi:hypothetical protein